MSQNIKRILAALLCLILMLTALPVALADGMKYLTCVGGGVNPHFANGQITGGGVSVFYGPATAADSAPQFTDTASAANHLRQAMKDRRSNIQFKLRLNYALPTTQTAFDNAVAQIMNNIMETAMVETDEVTEGDYLRYCFHSSQYGVGAQISSFSTLTINTQMSYFTTAAQEAELTQALETLLPTFNFTDSTDELTRIRTIYDYITSHVTYDYTNLNNDSYLLKYSAYAALIHGTSVCEGYALLFYRMAKMSGLRVRVITGCGGEGRDVNHGWNIVAVGDTFYYVDATWDAERPTYAYFLKGDTDFNGHTNEEKYNTTDFRTLYPIAEKGFVFDTPAGEELVSGHYRYTVKNGKATIVAYTGNEENIVVPAVLDGIPVTYVGDVFYGSTAKTITFSEGILGHSLHAVEYCPNLTAVHYPSTLQLSASAQAGFSDAPTNCPKLATITVAAANPYMTVENGVLYSKDKKTLILCPPANGMTRMIVPEGVTNIGPEAFAGHATMTEVVLPESVDVIASFAFSAARCLTKADIPDGCEYIGQYIYQETAVTTLHIPASVTTIRPFAFDFCYLTDISVDPLHPTLRVSDGVLHDNLRAIRAEVDTVGTITLPEGIVQLENGVFRGAADISEIRLPSTLQQIGKSAFADCDSLTHLTIPEGVTDIGTLAFGNCDRLVSIIFPDSVTEVGEYLFHPYNHTTIYGGTVAQSIAQTVPATYRPLSQFVCQSGHTLQETITEDDRLQKKYHFSCTVCNGKTADFTFWYHQLSEAEVTLSFTQATFTGAAITPDVLSVVYRGKSLTEGKDYTLTLPTNNVNAGTPQIWLCGIGDFRGNKLVTYTILPVDMATAAVTMPQTNFIYEGKPICPDFTVTWNGKELQRYQDYNFSYENNNAEGIATLVITGLQNYSGEIRKSFAIGEHEHHYESTAIDANTHQGICICGRTTAVTAHCFDNDCDRYCNDCYYQRSVTHLPEATWMGDGVHHYRKCSRCEDVTDWGEHSGGEATCSAGKICTVCQRSYGDLLPHDWDLSRWATGANYHYRPCKNCSAGEYHQPHHGGTATCTQQAQCADCGTAYGSLSPNTHANLITLKSVAATCTQAGLTAGKKCADCGTVTVAQQSLPKKSHTYKAGVCTSCGRKDPSSAPASNPFVDVKKSDYYCTPVLWAVQNGVTSGTSPSTFAPNDYCTRAQVVAFLWRAAGQPTPKSARNPFADVKNNQYYSKAVLWAVEKQVTSGVDATHFAPDDTCTRGQIVAFLYRFAGTPKVSASNPFTDVNPKQYYYKPVLWAVKNGVTTGTGKTTFSPEDTCTRAQVVTFLYRATMK